jgi:hypothetical protein
MEQPDRHRSESLREIELPKEKFDNISARISLIDVTNDDRFEFAGFNLGEGGGPYQC